MFLLFLFLAIVLPQGKSQVGNPAGDGTGQESEIMAVADFKGSSVWDFGAAMKTAATKLKASFDQTPQDGLQLSQSNGIRGLSSTLAWIFGTIALALPGLRMVFTSSESAMEEFIFSILMVGVFAAFLQSGNYERLCNGLTGMMSDLASSILPSGTNPVMQIIDSAGQTITAYTKALPISWKDVLVRFDYFIMSLVMGLITILLLMVSVFFTLIYLNIGNVLMAIALALGPIFVACGVWKVTKTFFDKWLHFVLIAGMYQVVATVLIVLVSKNNFLPVATDASAYESMANLIIVLFKIATVAYMSSFIPDIVNGLLPGAIGGMGHAGGVGRSAIGKGMQPSPKPKPSTSSSPASPSASATP